jgi:hypothetical protein
MGQHPGRSGPPPMNGVGIDVVMASALYKKSASDPALSAMDNAVGAGRHVSNEVANWRHNDTTSGAWSESQVVGGSTGDDEELFSESGSEEGSENSWGSHTLDVVMPSAHAKVCCGHVLLDTLQTVVGDGSWALPPAPASFL